MNPGSHNGVNINLISKTFLEPMGTQEKVQFILKEITQGKVLVLEHGLTPSEETKLIEATMTHIDQDRFTGIEMQSYGASQAGPSWARFLQRRGRPRMVVIGPADRLHTISKDNHRIQTVVVGSTAIGA